MRLGVSRIDFALFPEVPSEPAEDVLHMASEKPNAASIFNSARQIQSTDQRAMYLSEACGDDAALRERVEKLLKAFAEESQFLEKPAAGLPQWRC